MSSKDKAQLSTSRTLEDQTIAAWRTNNRATIFLIRNLLKQMWPMTVPGSPRRTVKSLAAHIHNARCMWITMLGKGHDISTPENVNLSTVTRSQFSKALDRSSRGIEALIHLGIERGGRLPSADWQNLPPDLVHFLNYFVAHEAHHRGQLCLIARQMGYRLPKEITAGLWQWKKHSRM